MTSRTEILSYDVVIVGAGPAGLAAAIRLKQLGVEQQQNVSVCVVEKGAEVGAHILSGAVLDPVVLDELLPEWRTSSAPVQTTVTNDHFVFLTRRKHIVLPTPVSMRNQGNYIISLGSLCRWLAVQAEALGVEIYPGVAAANVLFDDDGAVKGVVTGEMGVGGDGKPTDRYQPGVELHGRQTMLAEGCRGSLTRILLKRFKLRDGVDPQTYAIGIKELWELDASQHRPGAVIHTVGWPLDFNTYGGSFLYHAHDRQLAIGFVVGLDYRNPFLNPFKEFQRFKTHPAIVDAFRGARRIAFGARAISEGGFQSIPKLTFPGGLLVGDAAGFLDVPKLKGIHHAMKSGMIAAEAVLETLREGPAGAVSDFDARFRRSWVCDRLYRARNIRPSFRWGLFSGLAYCAIDTYLLRGRAPWTLHHPPDHTRLARAGASLLIDYPEPDGKVSFDIPSSVYLANTRHEKNQRCHLTLRDPNTPIFFNLPLYDAPEQRYCPAGVYEILRNDKDRIPHLQISPENCIHCKTCDIKDPTQNIYWTVPNGGDGPNYVGM